MGENPEVEKPVADQKSKTNKRTDKKGHPKDVSVKKTGFQPNKFSEFIQFSSNPVSGKENEFAMNDAIVGELAIDVGRVALNASNIGHSGANDPAVIDDNAYRVCSMVYAKKAFYGMSPTDKTVYGSNLSQIAKAVIDAPSPIVDSFAGVGKFNYNGSDFLPANAPLMCFSNFAKAVGTQGQNGLDYHGHARENCLVVNQNMAGVSKRLHADFAARYNSWANNQNPQHVVFNANNITMKPPNVTEGFRHLLPVLANFNVPNDITSLIAAAAALEPTDQNPNWQGAAGALNGVGVIVVNWDKNTQSMLFAKYLKENQQPLITILGHAFEIERNIVSMSEHGSAWQLMSVNDAIGTGAQQPFTVSEEQRMRGLMLGNRLDYLVVRNDGVHSQANYPRSTMRHIFLRMLSKNDQFL